MQSSLRHATLRTEVEPGESWASPISVSTFASDRTRIVTRTVLNPFRTVSSRPRKPRGSRLPSRLDSIERTSIPRAAAW